MGSVGGVMKFVGIIGFMVFIALVGFMGVTRLKKGAGQNPHDSGRCQL